MQHFIPDFLTLLKFWNYEYFLEQILDLPSWGHFWTDLGVFKLFQCRLANLTFPGLFLDILGSNPHFEQFLDMH